MKRRKCSEEIKIEVDFPEIDECQLDLLVEFLAELLAIERIREFEQSGGHHDGALLSIPKEEAYLLRRARH